nr:flavodoxin family protein [Candidatus Njordarchaeum guaymaensis]
MKVLVTYYSDTGNTEKIAEAIYEEVLKKQEADLKKLRGVTVESLNAYDLVFLGSPCHAGDLATPVKRILMTLPNSPKYKLAGFFTHMSQKGGYEKCVGSFEKTTKEKRVDFKGYYDCQGVPAPKVQELVKTGMKISDDDFKKYMEEARKHPSIEDVLKAKAFAREVLSKI